MPLHTPNIAIAEPKLNTAVLTSVAAATKVFFNTRALLTRLIDIFVTAIDCIPADTAGSEHSYAYICIFRIKNIAIYIISIKNKH